VDQIPVQESFTALAQTVPGAHPASVEWVPGLHRGRAARVGVDHPVHLAPKLKKNLFYNSIPHLGLRDLETTENANLSVVKTCLLYRWPSVARFERELCFSNFRPSTCLSVMIPVAV